MTAWQLTGRVVSGLGRGARFTSLEWARRAFIERLGLDPHPGTLNLKLDPESARGLWASQCRTHGEVLAPPSGEFCAARCLSVRIGGWIPGAIVSPLVPGYDPTQVELIAAVPLRQRLGLQDGDAIGISAMTDLSGVRAIVFDVDGTLVNSIEGIQIAAERAAAIFGYQVPIDTVRTALDQGESLWDMVVPPEARTDLELVQILGRETMRHWASVLDEYVRPFAGLGTTLAQLRDIGVRLAIVTGSRGESFLPLRRARLLDFFDPVITARHVARPKPAPDGLLRCLAEMGCEPSDAAYVGDSCDDMRAGKAAGMHTIGVLTGAADGAKLSMAGADRLAASHQSLPRLLHPGGMPVSPVSLRNHAVV